VGITPNRTNAGRTAAGAAPRPGRLRWRIGGLLGVGVLITYFDRVNLSVAGPALSAQFHLGPAELGLLFGAFFWSYLLLQIPGGLLLDRLGVKTISRWSAPDRADPGADAMTRPRSSSGSRPARRSFGRALA